MPTPTYTALANITLGSSAETVTFSSIPATYRDLVCVASFTPIGGGSLSIGAYLNGQFDNGTYSQVTMNGNGSSASSSSSSDAQITFQNDNSSGPTVALINVMDYSATDKHKTLLGRISAANSRVSAGAGRWASTSAVTSLSLRFSGLSLPAGSNFSLYGIAS